MDYPRAMLYPGVTQELVGEGELPKERTQSEVAEALRSRQVKGQGRVSLATKEAKENRIGASPTTRWRRPCIRVAVCLSIDQGKLLREHRGLEVGNRKGARKRRRVRRGSAPRAKHRLEKRWTRRSATMSQKRIYRS
ncbi:hypothetical protein B296_00014499 [Ensete ventricosum]|uniref:Uncharacterized protein n=1 Tax=Ensete ventricosum TaxID=4639 RepID=A0A426ZJX0_ENSVE|nr:hypothetical protein B296_00014499 [Ensete ventricosum]